MAYRVWLARLPGKRSMNAVAVSKLHACLQECRLQFLLHGKDAHQLVKLMLLQVFLLYARLLSCNNHKQHRLSLLRGVVVAGTVAAGQHH